MKHHQLEPTRLSESDIERYSRQVIIPDIGVAGQSALLAATVGVLGNATGMAEAARYLRAAGVGVVELRGQEDPEAQTLRAARETHHGISAEPLDCVVVTGIDAVAAALRRRLATSGQAVVWYSVRAGKIRGGVHLGGATAPWNEVTEAPENPAGIGAEDLHVVAACDAAAAAIAVVLGWGDVAVNVEVQLA